MKINGSIPRIKISEYKYGKVHKRLINAVDWINSNRTKIKKDILEDRIFWEFEYDDYWGMPKKLSHKLSPDEVYFIQSQVSGCFEECEN